MTDARTIETAVGERINQCLKNHPKYNQSSLVAELDPPMKQPNLSDILNGKTSLRLGHFLQICKILEKNPADLLRGIVDVDFFTVWNFRTRDLAQLFARIMVEIERFHPAIFDATMSAYRALRAADPALNPSGDADRRTGDRRKKGI